MLLHTYILYILFYKISIIYPHWLFNFRIPAFFKWYLTNMSTILPILACTDIFITITHHFYIFQMDMTIWSNLVSKLDHISLYFSNQITPTFSMSLMDLKKWGGMYDSYENVSERFRTFTYFVRTFLTYLSTDLGSTRNIETSVSSNRLPKRLVLVIHGAVWAEAHVAYEATVPCVAGISS